MYTLSSYLCSMLLILNLGRNYLMILKYSQLKAFSFPLEEQLPLGNQGTTIYAI